MNWTKVHILGMVFWLGFGLVGTYAQAQKPAVDIRTFVTREYVHGIPYHNARAYGSEAVPELLIMLEDTSLQYHWSGIIATLGFIGDTTAIDPLLTFLDQQEGELTEDAWDATLAIPRALGHLAEYGNQKALTALISLAREQPVTKTGIDFGFKHYQMGGMMELLGSIAVIGLGYSGQPEAMTVLEELQYAVEAGDLYPRWKDSISDAMNINLMLQKEGPDKLYKRQENEK